MHAKGLPQLTFLRMKRTRHMYMFSLQFMSKKSYLANSFIHKNVSRHRFSIFWTFWKPCDQIKNFEFLTFGVNHKPCGQNFGYFLLPLPPSRSVLQNKAYVIKWSFG